MIKGYFSSLYERSFQDFVKNVELLMYTFTRERKFYTLLSKLASSPDACLPWTNQWWPICLCNIYSRILSAQAVDITNPRKLEALTPLILAISVFNPLDANYRGKRRPVTKSSILSINLLGNSPFGIVNPKTNAWILIRSVIKSATSTPANVKQMYTSSMTSCYREQWQATHFMAGLAITMKSMAEPPHGF